MVVAIPLVTDIPSTNNGKLETVEVAPSPSQSQVVGGTFDAQGNRVGGKLLPDPAAPVPADRGPAKKADLRTGDIVLSVAGKEVRDLASFFRRVWAQGQAGVDVPMAIYRGRRWRRCWKKSSL